MAAIGAPPLVVAALAAARVSSPLVATASALAAVAHLHVVAAAVVVVHKQTQLQTGLWSSSQPGMLQKFVVMRSAEDPRLTAPRDCWVAEVVVQPPWEQLLAPRGWH
jgi:hypothetical protein